MKNFPSKADRPASDHSGEESPKATEGDEAPEFNDSDLVELFKPYGEIVSACVMKDEEGKSRGFGFVCFEKWQDAKKALD